MNGLVLHRDPTGSRWVGDLPLAIQRHDTGSWLITCHLPVGELWEERNQDLLSACFPTLRECRQALEALLAVDPLNRMHPQIASQARRVAPGRYRIGLISGQEAEAHKQSNGTWRVRFKDRSGWKGGRLVFTSLWRARVGAYLEAGILNCPPPSDDLEAVGYE